MDFKLIIPRSINLVNCPNCDAEGSLNRVRIDNIYDKVLLKVFKIRVYHCRECKWVGRFSLYKIRNNPGKVLLNYTIVTIIFLVFLFFVNIYFRK